MPHARKCKCAICEDGAPPEEAMMRLHRRVLSDVAEFGRSCIGIFPNEDSKDPTNDAHIYTIGNCLAGKPELLLFGMYDRHAMSILNDISEQMKTVADATEERAYDFGGKYPAIVIPASDDVKNAHMSGVRWHLGVENYDVMQVVFCDPDGRYPWDAGCAKPYSLVKVHRKARTVQ